MICSQKKIKDAYDDDKSYYERIYKFELYDLVRKYNIVLVSILKKDHITASNLIDQLEQELTEAPYVLNDIGWVKAHINRKMERDSFQFEFH